MAKNRSPQDRELDAIGSILRALDGLDGESIQRVLDYVFNRLSIAAPTRPKAFTTIHATSGSVPIEGAPRVPRQSIRDLKEQKQPDKSNQMAALVAYYLSELADDDEKKEAINTADLVKYFKQAGFKLPKALAQTLPNAAAAGYLDAVGNGLFKLNPVGYNLVAHGLPRQHKSTDTARRRLKTSRARSRRS